MEEKMTKLLKLLEEAKKRCLFYYEHCEEFDIDDVKRAKMIEHIKDIFSKLQFGFSSDDDCLASFNNQNVIKVTELFWDVSREEQIAALLHEINHAISLNNEFNDQVQYEDVDYLASYHIIEEGLADIIAELIMNYYYEHSGANIPEPEKLKNFTENTCGYPVNRKILKTMLLFMQSAGVDKSYLLSYYFGNKDKFFDIIKFIGGSEAFEMIVASNDARVVADDQRVADKYFRVLEDAFISEMEENDFSSKGFYTSSFDNVYIKGNDLGHALRISYFVSKMLKKFKIKNINKEMIDEIYNYTNGLISQISFSSIGYVASVVDELICYWIENCNNIDEFEYIDKIVPDVGLLNDCKYLELVFKKKENIDLKDIKVENIDKIIEVFNKLFYNKEYDEEFNDEEYGEVYSDNEVFFPIIQQIYNLASEEQLERFDLYNHLLRSEKVLLYINNIFGDDIDLTFEKLLAIVSNKELCRSISEFVDSYTKEQMICSYIDNCSVQNIYLIEELFPDAFTMNECLFWQQAVLLGKVSDSGRGSGERKKG